MFKKVLGLCYWNNNVVKILLLVEFGVNVFDVVVDIFEFYEWILC